MEIKDKNIEICRYLGLKEIKPGTFQFSNTPFKNLTQYKETADLRWHSDFNWLNELSTKVESIKDLTLCVQKNFASLYYRGEGVDGKEKPVFACSREKTTKISAIYEVLSTFVLWLSDNEAIKSDMELELEHVVYDEGTNQNIITYREIKAE